MPLDDLLGRMQREAEEQVAALLALAKADAERTAQDAEAAAARKRSERLAEREKALRAEADAALGRIRREGRQTLLTARHQAVDRILERTLALLPDLANDARYPATVAADLDRAVEVLGGRSGRLSVSRGLADQLRGRIPTGIELQVDDSEIGFRLQSSDGRIEVRATLRERFRRLAPALRIAAARALEESS